MKKRFVLNLRLAAKEMVTVRGKPDELVAMNVINIDE
jgi:hypothetical protein